LMNRSDCSLRAVANLHFENRRRVMPCPLCAKSGPMQCSMRSPRCCVGIVLILDPPLAVPQPALGEHFHVDFVLVGPIANNLDLGRSGELPRLPLFENNLLIGLYILRCKGLANPLPYGNFKELSAIWIVCLRDTSPTTRSGSLTSRTCPCTLFQFHLCRNISSCQHCRRKA